MIVDRSLVAGALALCAPALATGQTGEPPVVLAMLAAALAFALLMRLGIELTPDRATEVIE